MSQINTDSYKTPKSLKEFQDLLKNFPSAKILAGNTSKHVWKYYDTPEEFSPVTIDISNVEDMQQFRKNGIHLKIYIFIVNLTIHLCKVSRMTI